ncbi:ead/Ea22-like family protein [Geminicoccus flavidas]|uniref:ead/Ea22-like family protein n=1 Tax=Geminicoccus flavidas TaxID=2506407 RepID=UPI00135A42F1|nr:ead/Ea22-like family protein [Geminicoccus flavidas]
MDLNIEAMKAAARAATQGEWSTNGGSLVICDGAHMIDCDTAEDAAHVATTSPAAVLALIEELERTQRNRDMWKGQCERQAAELRRIHNEQAEAVGFKP